MSHTRKLSWLLVLAPLLAGACEMPSPFKVKDRKPHSNSDAPFDPPNTYPGWAYDAPNYTKPVQELSPEPKARPGDPLHYFTKEKIIMIRQPAGYTAEEIPRVAIWWTDNNGFHWQKAGYFGREQSYFPFEVEEDGDYGIRFVGPGQEQSMQALANPERVYHVDTSCPEVELAVEPEQTWYNVGQNIMISWRTEDYHLIEAPVNVTALLDFSADESKPAEIQRNLAKEGTLTYTIPPEALNYEMRFRVDSLDRANNLGIAYSFALQVVPEAVDHPDANSRQGVEGEEVSFKRQRPAASLSDPDEIIARQAPTTEAPSNDIQADDKTLLAADRKQQGEYKIQRSLPYATAAARAPYAPSDGRAAVRPTVRGGGDPPGDPSVSVFPGASKEAAKPAAAQTDPSPAPSQPLSMRPLRNPQSELENPEMPALAEGSPDDLTHGNRLIIPMPATVVPTTVDRQTAMAHPWRRLMEAMDGPLKTVWALPRTRFIENNPLLRSLFLAGRSKTQPVGEPAAQDGRFVGLPPDKPGEDSSP